MELDILDRKLLNIIQARFPVTSRPYQEIALSLNISEEKVLERITRLKKEEIIKQIRGVFDYQKLGYQGVLCAAAVEETDIEQTAEFINHYSGVTHNYLRSHFYNLWFTLITPSEKKRYLILEEIKRLDSIKELMVLPSLQLFKIKVDFHFDEVEKCK